MLVLTHLQLREFDKALEAIKLQLAEQSDNPLLYNLEGGVYLGKRIWSRRVRASTKHYPFSRIISRLFPI